MYRERALPADPSACCVWEQAPGDARVQLVVPDACVDLIWSGGERLTVAGPDTAAREVVLDAGAHLRGVRLRPGAAGTSLGLPASELCDEVPSAEDVLGHDVAARLLDALHGGEDPFAVLRSALCDTPPDPLIAAAVEALDVPEARVADVAADLGVSERQLRRRVTDAVGYGPKVLARVLRFRRVQALGDAVPLAERALDAGYADQAHMTAEVTRLAGMPPGRFLKDRRPTLA